MNLTRISRLVQLLGLLQAGKAHNAQVLNPLPLRQLIAERAQRVVNLYNGHA